MDEPTNDLDLETLELLEDLLLEFSGTLLLVSHDRAFLNNLVTSTIVLNGNGEAEEFVGGYDNWQHQILLREEKKISHKLRKSNPIPLASSTAPDRLSYKEKRAFEAQKKMLAELPGRIETLEDEQQLLTAAMADTAFYQQDRSAIASAADRLKKLEDEITAAYKCWEDLGYLEN